MSPTPIQRLSATGRATFLAHLSALDREDRRLRFGVPISDEGIRVYVESIDFERDEIFAAHDDALALVGAAHVAFGDDGAELGISVAREARRQGIGSALFRRASEHVRNRFHRRLFMHCLSENTAMMNIARRAGMSVVVDHGDADAFLRLPPASPASVTQEAIADRLAVFDYALKTQLVSLERMTKSLRGIS